ncbi:GFA family protein [Tsuneonella amylolytica]|uniref:GFA family protein n=1 Tax=Tsuneonella amylolytica TaxID=2338327 RepID=UPI000EA9A4B7|nr:GFA family protein [Tsuneonella amylolytica]
MIATGQCRCGQLTFSVEGAPLLTGACHCRGCQRMTGSAFSLTSAFPADAFTVTTGDPVVGGAHGDEARHYHCDHCKSWVFTRPAAMPFVNVRTPMLDEPPPGPPFVESQTAEGFDWARTGAKHSFARFPDERAYQSLIAEFTRTHSD